MKLCFCKAILGVLVIVFAWWHVSWAAIALTVVGAIIIAMSFWRGCCCKDKNCDDK